MIKISCKKKLNDLFTIDADLEIKSGDFVALHGKSGSGKTTLLRLLAGFLKPDSGEIKKDSIYYASKTVFMPPQKRNIGYLFQDYALFPNMNVLKNLLFANNDKDLANELLELVGLQAHKNDHVNSLSGGQKQRVALARALMRKPDILLLDEPLSALDNAIRQKLQDYLLVIHNKFKMTTILVSHDVSEIYKLANIVYELEDGKIARSGTPAEIFLKSSGSQKFSFHAKILDIQKRDTVYVAIVEIAGQISEIVLTKNELEGLNIGGYALACAKAFKISLKAIK
ncbi:ABC transporter ATP-binding protein [Campylobacter hyointestinalis]|uniref:Molybdenum ABC transporter ATP-binding protein n=1 Tax=Campylobacter hyointestinalis subsp. hyointestinalis TaxID=91352 RepID=A0A855N446_CAMHY|nr:ABC transporter ATP-binding protein [Campylobacter hyointestinalis]PPB57339.1 molybdenum ABC transporter ATP-binding protein [Campylobacter hyointestinalis subsp. hyointestinalis]PPB62327.1 molybdenum ABC transporter ATP-binding protein [Campylobacter hyointestinalis subsp. hyointestinalis]PPB71097.1 molybdenum ABC transporter ATP-binding protein [Campylobacter hyointestinalis subsp. hyointestinalis]